MRIPRIYTSQSIQVSQELKLEEQASLHLIKVLRMQEGDTVTLFNGLGGEYACEISHAHKKSAGLIAKSFIDRDTESPLKLHLALGISKGDKMELIIQKATELGVVSIAPLMTEHSDVKMNQERMQKKHAQWQQIATSACEQSGRNKVPLILPLQDFYQWQDSISSEQQILIFHTSNGQPLSQHPHQEGQALHLCFGPEGGLSPKEVTQAGQSSNNHIITLGDRVLRAETAPLACLGAAQVLWGDW